MWLLPNQYVISRENVISGCAITRDEYEYVDKKRKDFHRVCELDSTNEKKVANCLVMFLDEFWREKISVQMISKWIDGSKEWKMKEEIVQESCRGWS